MDGAFAGFMQLCFWVSQSNTSGLGKGILTEVVVATRSATEIDANDRLLIAGDTLCLVDVVSIAKYRHLQEQELVVNGVPLSTTLKVLVEAV